MEAVVLNGQASRTAVAAARYRAEHQDLDCAFLFRDPLARLIVGDAERRAEFLSEDARRRMRLFIASRSRFAEDALADAVPTGTLQAIILGAGLDTFAYRNPHPNLRVFEVDHPDTQQWKRHRLAAADIDIPTSVTYVPLDFEHERLSEALTAADFDPHQRAFVIWLGVTVYLTRQAITDTVHHLGGLAPGTQVVFDYATTIPESAGQTSAGQTSAGHTSARETRVMAEERQERQRRLAAIGERWISFFSPEEMSALLRDNGLHVEEDLPAAQLPHRYLGRRPPTSTTGPHIVRARVVGR
jgi:methyltransferase (TIGR00027 family)